MLHLVFQAQLDEAVLDRIADGDAVVFLGSGVFSLLQAGQMAALLQDKLARNRLYALTEDLAVRGISPSDLAPAFETIDYAELVQLTVAHTPIQSWC